MIVRHGPASRDYSRQIDMAVRDLVASAADLLPWQPWHTCVLVDVFWDLRQHTRNIDPMFGPVDQDQGEHALEC